MMKKLIHFPEKLTFSVGILLLAAPAVHAAEPPAPPQVDAKAYILMDYNSGKVLTEGNADTRLDPASLTKIMSSYVIGQAIKAGKIKPEDLVTVGKTPGRPVTRRCAVLR